jgi:hypothetical protein
MSPRELRTILQNNLDETIFRLNQLLSGQNLGSVKPVLKRLGRNQALPHWYQQLKKEHALPNLDGKTIGSII